LRAFAAIPAKTAHQIGKLQQVRNAQQRAFFAENYFRVGRHDIRPLPRHGADGIVVYAQ